MEVPAQPVDGPSALRDEVVAVVNQKPDLACWPVQMRHRQIGLA
jgi:hypothetical protein